MLDIFTVSFFGHREINDYYNLENQLQEIIYELLSQKQYVEFLVGKNGEFDHLVSLMIHKLKKKYRDDNSCHTLVLPYVTAEYRNNYDSFNEYYDRVDIYGESRSIYFKNAIQKRNRQMIDKSDLSIFYIEREYGGAYQTYKYALSKRKVIRRLDIEG